MTFSFEERLAFSVGANGQSDIDIIRRCHQGTVDVCKTDIAKDKSGIDYIATLKGGVAVRWDAKRRDKGCSQYWFVGPEFALERWSNKERRTPGWTWDISKKADYILFTFDASDHGKAYAIPFQHLRTAFHENGHAWCDQYRVAEQPNEGWVSECVFVPVHEVLAAVNAQMVLA